MAVVKQKLTAKWYLVHDGTDILTQSDSVYTGELSFNDATHTCEEYATEALMDTRVLDFPLVSTTLNDGLISHWKFNDNALDSVGSHDITLFNSPTYITGVNDKAIKFDAATQYGVIPNHVDLDRQELDFAYLFVFRFNTLINLKPVISRWFSGQTQFIVRPVSGKLECQFRKASDSSAIVTANNLGSLSTGVWYMASIYKYGQNVGMRINDAAVETAIDMGEEMKSSNRGVVLAHNDGGSNYADIEMDELELRSERLTDAEWTEKYDGGAIKGYPYT